MKGPAGIRLMRHLNLYKSLPQIPIPNARRPAGRQSVPFLTSWWLTNRPCWFRDSNLRPPSCEADALTTRPSQLVSIFSVAYPWFESSLPKMSSGKVFIVWPRLMYWGLLLCFNSRCLSSSSLVMVTVCACCCRAAVAINSATDTDADAPGCLCWPTRINQHWNNKCVTF